MIILLATSATSLELSERQYKSEFMTGHPDLCPGMTLAQPVVRRDFEESSKYLESHLRCATNALDPRKLSMSRPCPYQSIEHGLFFHQV
jgi:hypothetical protein